jgi:predicted transcriptional regulator
MSKRRGRLEIIHDLLNAINSKGGKIKPTHLLYKSNLSHSKMMQYIKELTDNGMITDEADGDKKMYLITDRGIEYLNEFQKMRRFSESFGLEN